MQTQYLKRPQLSSKYLRSHSLQKLCSKAAMAMQLLWTAQIMMAAVM